MKISEKTIDRFKANLAAAEFRFSDDISKNHDPRDIFSVMLGIVCEQMSLAEDPKTLRAMVAVASAICYPIHTGEPVEISNLLLMTVASVEKRDIVLTSRKLCDLLKGSDVDLMLEGEVYREHGTDGFIEFAKTVTHKLLNDNAVSAIDPERTQFRPFVTAMITRFLESKLMLSKAMSDKYDASVIVTGLRLAMLDFLEDDANQDKTKDLAMVFSTFFLSRYTWSDVLDKLNGEDSEIEDVLFHFPSLLFASILDDTINNFLIESQHEDYIDKLIWKNGRLDTLVEMVGYPELDEVFYKAGDDFDNLVMEKTVIEF